MAKNYSKLKFTRKSLIAALCALSVTCTGLAAACAPAEDENKPAKPSREDSALLKNGSFEYFDIPDDAVYLIKNVKDWTLGGDSSVKSGIIGTSGKDWDALVAEDLADKLEYNYDLGSTHDEYIDYNSMRKRDVLYKDPYAALLEKDDVKDSLISHQGYENYFGIKDGKYNGKTVYENKDDGEYYFDEEFTKNIRYEVINNPETHYGKYEEKDGKFYLGTTEVYKDDDGNLFSDKDKKNPAGNVLMVHNYSTDGKYNGIQQYYTSATINLEANTAAEISLWVKTSDLKFDKGYDALDEQDKGAFIDVVQTVGGNSVDSFAIKNINTEKIIKYASADSKTVTESNGWINYKIYVNACDFASSTIQLKLGLGREGDAEKCTGYAFFDDVTVTKYRDLQDIESYKENSSKLGNTTCTLISEKEDKIFNADKEMREPAGNATDFNNAYDFHYAIDLASETDKSNGYNAVKLDQNNVKAALTSEKADGKVYATSESNSAQLIDVTSADQSEKYDLVKKKENRPTENDVVGTFAANADFALFNGKDKDYSKLLKDALTGDKGISKLPKYNETNSNMLVMLSSYGAAYTSTIYDVPAFDLSKTQADKSDKYLVVSFWIKTSNMNGKTAATLKIYDVADTDKEDAQTLTIDTTGVTTNFENEKDIYNGWTQCFFFVKNSTKYSDTASENEKKFNIDFSFGNTNIQNAASYEGGWAAVANLQTLEIDEEVYKLASAGTYTALFSFDSKDDDKSGNKLDEANSTSDIKTGIATPSTYNGLNGANSAVSKTDSNPSYDAYNTHTLAGLINKDYESDYGDLWSNIATSFDKAGQNWANVFGEDCYQPLIIINNLRSYADNVTATEETYEKYYIEAEDGNITIDGKTYKSAKGTEWDETQTYYSINKASNYGFAGESKTASADSYVTISVKVMVAKGAKAYIYLVDSDNPKNVLSYTTPAYTFWYDKEGNVLDEEFDEDWKESEHRNHIVYTLRNDGLYDGKDGKVYANLHNLIKSYRNYKFEHNDFFNENGEKVSFDNLVNGETYYSNAEKTIVTDHYLVNSDNKRIYECVDGKYYYLEDGKRTTEVTNFDEEAYARYDHETLDKPYAVEVTDTNGEWKTVNFNIHTGSKPLNYRLELWSGARNETGVNEDDSFAEGAVAFDYSAYALSADTYSGVISKYETDVINNYKELLKDHTDVWANKNIAYYEEQAQKLVDDGKINQADLDAIKAEYGANYYTYTLYDSESYVPFNANTAEDGETGYEYNASDFGEVLAYFTCEDEEQNSINVFADYSAVDQSISLGSASDDGEDGDEEEDSMSGDVWLYVSSIVLVVVLLATLAAILIKDMLKKKRASKGSKQRNKNVYRQRDRYIKKLHLVKNEEEPETEQPAENSDVPAEQPLTDTTVEESTEQTENVEPAQEDAPSEQPEEPSAPAETDSEESNENGENQ